MRRLGGGGGMSCQERTYQLFYTTELFVQQLSIQQADKLANGSRDETEMEDEEVRRSGQQNWYYSTEDDSQTLAGDSRIFICWSFHWTVQKCNKEKLTDIQKVVSVIIVLESGTEWLEAIVI